MDDAGERLNPVSAYQYYEFAALDHVLNQRQQSELRAISTRAQITPVSFVNTYAWGDLKADPRKLVERYFDAFLYLANWGTHQLMFRFPAQLFGAVIADATRYCVGAAAAVWTSRDHTIIELVAENEDGTFEEDWSYGAGEGRLAAIVPARAELLSGDLRLLYLVWLLCVQSGQVPDDMAEPPVPPNLGDLNASLQSVATFLRIDEDLLAVAASASTRRDVEAAATAELGAWLTTIPRPEKDALLLRVAEGNGQRVQEELRARYRRTVTPADSDERRRRTVAELLGLAEARRQDRLTLARQRRERQAADRERAAAAAREERLASLAERGEQAWRHVADLIEAKKPADYDAAVALLRDLGEISRREGRTDSCERRVAQLRQTHRRKSTFIERLDRALSS